MYYRVLTATMVLLGLAVALPAGQPGEKAVGPEFKTKGFVLTVGKMKTASEVDFKDPAKTKFTLQLDGSMEIAPKLDVAAVLKAYGVKRIVIAHTPHLSGIQVLHDGHVIMVDTGIMHAYGGVHSFLSIEGATINAHNGDAVTELKTAENPVDNGAAGVQP